MVVLLLEELDVYHFYSNHSLKGPKDSDERLLPGPKRMPEDVPLQCAASRLPMLAEVCRSLPYIYKTYTNGGQECSLFEVLLVCMLSKQILRDLIHGSHLYILGRKDLLMRQ